MTHALRKKGREGCNWLAMRRVWCRERQPGEPKCWLVTVNHQQSAAGLLQGFLPGTAGCAGLINGLEMNPRLLLIKCEGGKRMYRVVSDKTAPS